MATRRPGRIDRRWPAAAAAGTCRYHPPTDRPTNQPAPRPSIDHSRPGPISIYNSPSGRPGGGASVSVCCSCSLGVLSSQTSTATSARVFRADKVSSECLSLSSLVGAAAGRPRPFPARPDSTRLRAARLRLVAAGDDDDLPMDGGPTTVRAISGRGGARGTTRRHRHRPVDVAVYTWRILSDRCSELSDPVRCSVCIGQSPCTNTVEPL